MKRNYEEGLRVEDINPIVNITAGNLVRRPRWKDETGWLKTHDLDVSAEWVGFPQCVPGYASADGPFQPLPGFGLLEIDVKVISDNNGGHETAVLAGGGRFITESDLDFCYSFAIDLAIKAGQINVEAKLRQEYKEHRYARRTWEANKNTYYLHTWAKATGTCGVNQVRGWRHVVGLARFVYIGEPNGTELLRNLIEDNNLQKVAEEILTRLSKEREPF